MPELRRVVIIGSGPAGLTTAIYTARADLSPLVVEGEPSSTSDQPGGQLMLTTDVENYPGFADGIMGPELMATMRAQASRFGSSFLTAKVTKIDLADRPFRIWLSNSHYGAEPAILAESVVVATGARSLLLGIEGERRLLGYGVSTCATCDGFFFRGKELAVVGGGDSALEEALFLTKFASKVSVIHRRKELRASKIMQDRAFRNPRIEIRWNTVVEGILGARSVEAVSLRDVVDDRRSTLAVGGVFVAIGHAPNTDLFKGHLDMDAAGYLDTHHGTLTSVPGVFAAGDVQDHVYRQAVTAAGSGCMAALDVERWLDEQSHPAKERKPAHA